LRDKVYSLNNENDKLRRALKDLEFETSVKSTNEVQEIPALQKS